MSLVAIVMAVSATGLNAQTVDADSAHLSALQYPSATTCGGCHPTEFKQWSVSPHAYAQLSPVFNAMQATVTKLTNGTNGDFCIRCHNTTGLSRDEPLFTANASRDSLSREGITCVTCHRVNGNYGKISGRMALQAGDIYQPIFGPTGDSGLKQAQANPEMKLATANDRTRRRPVHLEVSKLFLLPKPGFCGLCHDVTSPDGFRLEEAFSEYKHSPAAREGVTCQDCHMGKTQGAFSGDEQTNFDSGPAAIVGGHPTRIRRLTDHTFAGPDYSIVHPGLFPHNTDATELASLTDWLSFDYEAGWGTDAFEDTVSDDYPFPDAWSNLDDRYDARDIIDAQLKTLDGYMQKRWTVLRNGFQIAGVETEAAGPDGLRFTVTLKNGTDGHNVPTGFIAERLVYLRVTVTDADGHVVYASGDLDPDGDVRDAHSLYVHDGLLPRDPDLFTLQSKFLTLDLVGGERERVLAVDRSLDPLPFLRPPTSSAILTGRPAAARIHRVGIPPHGTRTAEYRVPSSALTGSGPYTADVRLVAGMVPVNLIAAIQGVGFDYGMSAAQVAHAVVRRHAVLWEYRAVIDPARGPSAASWAPVDIQAAPWDARADSVAGAGE